MMKKQYYQILIWQLDFDHVFVAVGHFASLKEKKKDVPVPASSLAMFFLGQVEPWKTRYTRK